MRIAEIQIERFGGWQNLNLPMTPGHLSVFYGPNEAGKTTLMRFVRGVFYGFTPHVTDLFGEQTAKLPRSGSLKVERDGAIVRLHRCGMGGSRGEIALTGLDQPRTGQDWLHDALRGINEKVFENVYAIGLKELQELGSLADEDVSKHVYGLSLGPEGRRLLDAWNHIHTRRASLVSDDQTDGRLVGLFRRQDELRTRLAGLSRQKSHYSQLAQEKFRLDDEIASLRNRQSGVAGQLRGHQFLAKAYAPWRRVRHLEQELRAIPIIDDFPERGVPRLEKLERDISEATTARSALLVDAKGIRSRLGQLATGGDLRKHAAAMQGLLDQRVLLVDLRDRVRATEDKIAEEELQLDELRGLVGSNWTLAQIDHADISAPAHHRMTDVARKYQRAHRRVKLLRKHKARLDKHLGEKRDLWRTGLAALNGRSIEEETLATRAHLDNLKKIARLELHEAELEDRQVGIEDDMARCAPRVILPPWVYLILSLFCFAGLMFAASGLWAGITHSGIAGGVYALLGLTCTLIAWAFKTQWEGDARDRLTEIEAESRANLAELHETRVKLSKITGRTVEEEARSNSVVSRAVLDKMSGKPVVTGANGETVLSESDPRWYYSGDGAAWHALPKSRRHRSLLRRIRRWPGQMWRAFWSGPEKLLRVLDLGYTWTTTDEEVERQRRLNQRLRRSEALADADAIADEAFGQLDLVQTITQKLVELERLATIGQTARSMEARFATLEKRTQAARKELRNARHAWGEFLKQVRFPENLTIKAAHDLWQRLVDTREQRSNWKASQLHLENLKDLWNTWTQRIEELGHRLQMWDVNYSNPLEVLAGWEKQLAHLAKHKAEHRELRGRFRGRRKEARGHARRIDECRVQRNALLTQGGAANRDEFVKRADTIARRYEIDRELTNVRYELQNLCRGYEDLALVEDDMLRFDAIQNDHCITTLLNEQADLERDLADACDELARIEQELLKLEEDTEATDLRFELARVDDDLKQATEDWLALESTTQIVDGMRLKYERTCQPKALIDASKFLDRLTNGKYRNIWTPLGEQKLFVDTDDGRAIPVELLSSGTREQLFLSLRLTVVQDLARQGIHLPMILDDVFVNFDQHRAKLAAQVLIDFSKDGHQLLLFTCHQHLAEAFDQLGIPPTRLPSRKDMLRQHDLPQRLAG